MRGEIDKKGILFIERKGIMARMYCPYSHNEDYCSTWCPLFDDSDADINQIRLCNGNTIDIKDKRS